MPKLTKRLIDAAEPGLADDFLWCAELPGFGVKIPPSGRKVFLCRYRNKDGRQRKFTIGRVCDLTVDQARDMARKVYVDVAGGRDPVAEKDAYRKAPTVQDLRDRYMAEHAAKHKKPRSVKSDDDLWRLHILPAWADRKVASIELQDVMKLHGDMSVTPGAANRTLALISKALNLAEPWGWRSMNSNPCGHVKRYQSNEVGGSLTRAQLQQLGKAMREAEETRASHAHMVPLIMLLLFTGCRLNEVLSAEWGWINEDACTLNLPDSKTGARAVRLSPAAMAVLDMMRGRRGVMRVTYRGRLCSLDLPEVQRYLFPGAKPGQHLAPPNRAWKRLLLAAGLPKTIRMHDLRHTVGTMAHKSGMSQREVAELLGHRQLSTTERYLHAFDEDQQTGAAITSNVIAGFLGQPAATADTVNGQCRTAK